MSEGSRDGSLDSSAGVTWAADAELATGDDLVPSAPLAEPEQIARFVVLDRLGAGSMGVVYAAWDPDLDRRVALKLVRPDRGGASAHGRLMREAQAMAKLSHPNVVSIYEVGSYRGARSSSCAGLDRPGPITHGPAPRGWVDGTI